MTSDKELIEMVVNPNLLEEEYIYKAMQYHVQTHPSVHFDGNTFKNIDNGRDAYSKSFIEDFLKQCEEFPPSHDDHCYSPPVDWIWDDPLSTITSNTLSIGGRIKGKGDLISLHQSTVANMKLCVIRARSTTQRVDKLTSGHEVRFIRDFLN